MNWLKSSLSDQGGKISVKRTIAAVGAIEIIAVNLMANIAAVAHKATAVVDFAPQQVVIMGVFLAAVVSEVFQKKGGNDVQKTA